MRSTGPPPKLMVFLMTPGTTGKHPETGLAWEEPVKLFSLYLMKKKLLKNSNTLPFQINDPSPLTMGMNI